MSCPNIPAAVPVCVCVMLYIETHSFLRVLIFSLTDTYGGSNPCPLKARGITHHSASTRHLVGIRFSWPHHSGVSREQHLKSCVMHPSTTTHLQSFTPSLLTRRTHPRLPQVIDTNQLSSPNAPNPSCLKSLVLLNSPHQTYPAAAPSH